MGKPNPPRPLSHKEKVAYLIADLKERGVGASTSAPPVYRLLWVMGLKVRPPHFQSFLTLTLSLALAFGIPFGLSMWLVQWRSREMNPSISILLGLAAGLLFGLIMAAYFRNGARKLKLPAWEDYPPAEGTSSKPSAAAR